MDMGPKWIPALAGALLCARSSIAAPADGNGGTTTSTSATANAPSSVPWWEKATHPLPWLSWGSDLRFRNEFHANATTLSSGEPNSDYNYQRYRARLWTSLEPITNLALNARLATEPRVYQLPESRQGVSYEEALIDDLNIAITNLLDQPLRLVVGRQSFNFGNKWLIWDGTSWDASRTEFFNAARLTWDWREGKTRTDVICLDQHREADYGLPVINSTGQPLSEQDERGAILYLSNKSLPATTLDGYFLYRHEYHPFPVVGDVGDLYVFGGRGEGDLGEHWKYRAEFANELGRKNDHDLNAFGVNTRLSYFVKDTWNHNFRLGYEYLSGDDPGTGTDEGWDAMWGRRAQWSELLTLTFATEANGRKSDWTNLQRVDAGWSFNPHPRVEVLLDYMPLFANSHPEEVSGIVGNSGYFRGHLAAAVIKFVFSKHLTGHLWGEVFFPGDYYAPGHRDTATFLRVELFATL
jgi:hypothetical protein